MGTLIVGAVVLVLVCLAARSIYKNKKAGKCCGDCGHCGGACHCFEEKPAGRGSGKAGGHS